MLKYWNQHHSQRGGGGALAALVVLLLPALWPSLFTPLGHASPSIFSEWNAPKPRHLSLLKGALQRGISDEQKSELWSPLPHQGWKPCNADANSGALPEKSTGYIQVFLDGGLNQQRMGICDAVAVAKILNATLVIPHLEVNPVWQDSSSFEEIYDVDHFINVLKDEISIVRTLPDEYSWSTREYYAVAIRATRIKTAPVHASANWYPENVIPVLQRNPLEVKDDSGLETRSSTKGERSLVMHIDHNNHKEMLCASCARFIASLICSCLDVSLVINWTILPPIYVEDSNWLIKKDVMLSPELRSLDSPTVPF